MTTTIPEVFENLGKVPRDLADRLDHVTNVIRRAAARQEALRRQEGELAFVSEAQKTELEAAGDRVRRALDSYVGLGRLRLVARMLDPRRW